MANSMSECGRAAVKQKQVSPLRLRKVREDFGRDDTCGWRGRRRSLCETSPFLPPTSKSKGARRGHRPLQKAQRMGHPMAF